ncbi:MAG TPA: hypothetical protein VMD91_16545 [Candidatus Sulfotelmatobacter sp.]|nr:hypothetical protein [Candidatus Sulfotelmatobacter sp.]
MPLASFTAIMGIIALGLAWRLAADAWAVPAVIGEALVLGGIAAFALLLLRWARRIAAHPDELRAESHVAITASYYGTLAIALSVTSAALVRYQPAVALVLWAVAALGGMALLIYLLGHWIETGLKDVELTPALLLPVVGNAVSVYPAAALGVVQLAWFSFAAAFVCWLALYPLTMYRLLVVEPRLPRRMAPQLGILVSSPAVFANAWFTLNGGVVDAFVLLFAFKALFCAILVARMWRIGYGEPYNVAMWGWAFPAAALAGAFMRIALRTGAPLYSVLAVLTVTAASLIALTCALLTLRGWIRAAAVVAASAPSVQRGG